MGQRIIIGHEQGSEHEVAVLFDSVTGWAFGPVFDERDGIAGEDRLEAFLDWLEGAAGTTDLRSMKESEVEALVARWRSVAG